MNNPAHSKAVLNCIGNANRPEPCRAVTSRAEPSLTTQWKSAIICSGPLPAYALRVQVTPACRQTFALWSDLRFFGQECPWNRSPGMLWFTRMPMTRACSTGLQCRRFGRAPPALAHQLPRIAGSKPGLDPSQETLMRRARTGPYRQHCNCHVHQPTRWSTLPSHVTTRPPPQKSEASEVASLHSHSGLAQLGSRMPLPIWMI